MYLPNFTKDVEICETIIYVVVHAFRIKVHCQKQYVSSTMFIKLLGQRIPSRAFTDLFCTTTVTVQLRQTASVVTLLSSDIHL